MNVRKKIDYSTMFDAMRVTMSEDISQILRTGPSHLPTHGKGCRCGRR